MGENVSATVAQVYYRNGGWHFRTKGANGEVIARDNERDGKGYSRQTDARAAAEASVPAGTEIHVSSKTGDSIKTYRAGEADEIDEKVLAGFDKGDGGEVAVETAED